jgi:SAM-dependent methyltransferase
MSETSTYIHGTHPEEQRRLSAMNEDINEMFLHQLDLKVGECILDVGSGLGQFSRAMARRAEACNVVGVERSPEQIATAMKMAAEAGDLDKVDFRGGDAMALPLRDDEWGTFDLAHTRFLLEHVKDPLAVVKGMVRAVKPGGRIVLTDDDHPNFRLWPEPPGFESLWNAYVHSYEKLGNDPFVGRRLVSLLHQAGATPTRNTWVFFGGCAGQGHFSRNCENIDGILSMAKRTIVDEMFFEEEYYEQALANFREWTKRPDAAMWYGIAWAEGRRPD